MVGNIVRLIARSGERRECPEGLKVVDEYATYLRAAGLSPATIRLRRFYLSRVSDDLDADDLLALTARDLLAWLASHDWSPETMKSARATLRSFYDWAVEDGLIEVSPASKLRPIRVPVGVPHPAPDHVFHTAMGQASDRDRIMLMLAAHAGLRRAEIAGLEWSRVEWAGLRITGKGGRTRTIPMVPQLQVALTAELERRNHGVVGSGWRYAPDPASPYVFPGLRGGHIGVEAVGETLSKLLGPGWTGHTLRHRFATRAYAVERDLLTVQALMGHSKPETTARYTAPPDGAARAAVSGTVD